MSGLWKLSIKLYTLQECFEQAGSKFPFKVDIHYLVSGIDSDYGVIIVGRDKTAWMYTHNGKSNILPGVSNFYDHKSHQYKNEFENLLS